MLAISIRAAESCCRLALHTMQHFVNAIIGIFSLFIFFSEFLGLHGPTSVWHDHNHFQVNC